MKMLIILIMCLIIIFFDDNEFYDGNDDNVNYNYNIFYQRETIIKQY